jgi:hypothetical protein
MSLLMVQNRDGFKEEAFEGILNAAGNMLIKYIRTTNVWRGSAGGVRPFTPKKKWS